MTFDPDSHRLRSEWSGPLSDEPARPPDDTASHQREDVPMESSEGQSAAAKSGMGYAVSEPLETQTPSPDLQQLDAIIWPDAPEKDYQQFTLANLMTLFVVVSAGFATLQFTSLEVFAAGAGATAFGLLVLLAVVPDSALLRLAWWIALATYLAASTMAML